MHTVYYHHDFDHSKKRRVVIVVIRKIKGISVKFVFIKWEGYGYCLNIKRHKITKRNNGGEESFSEVTDPTNDDFQFYLQTGSWRKLLPCATSRVNWCVQDVVVEAVSDC